MAASSWCSRCSRSAVLIVGVWPAPLLDVMRATTQHLSEQLLMSKIVP